MDHYAVMMTDAAQTPTDTDTTSRLSEPGEYDETFQPEGSPSLRQGDILELIGGGKESDPWAMHLGVLVTADCDLAFGKHAGRLTYVPVVPVGIYIKRLLIPRLVERQFQKERRSLVERVDTNLADRLVELLQLGRGVNEVADLAALQLSSSQVPKDKQGTIIGTIRRLGALQNAIQALTQEDIGTDPAVVLTALALEIDGITSASPGKKLKDLRTSIVENLSKAPPGEIFVLNRVSHEYNEGYVAVLRLIREIRDSEVARSPIEERSPGRTTTFKARRIARLDILYTHRLVQQMAQVFTDIGLPVAYENRRAAMSATQVEALFEKGPS